jgi:hypothetical protein
MPEDGSNFDGGDTPKTDQTDQFGDTPTIPTSTVSGQGSSRRAFLKAAVIGSAAVAAAGSAGAAALNLTVKKPGAILRLNSDVASGGCSGCATGSSSNSNDAADFDIDCKGNASNPGDFYFWFTDPSLAAGSYTLVAQVNGIAIGSGAAFDFKASNSVHQYNPSSPDPCPDMPTQPDNQVVQQDDLSTAFNHPGGVFEVGIHVDYVGGSISPDATRLFTITFTLFNVDDQSVCGGEAAITGHNTCS